MGLVGYTNMAAGPLLTYTNMAAVRPCYELSGPSEPELIPVSVA